MYYRATCKTPGMKPIFSFKRFAMNTIRRFAVFGGSNFRRWGIEGIFGTTLPRLFPRRKSGRLPDLSETKAT